MPNSWNEIGAGPAPWADQTSFSYTTETVFTDFFSNTGGIITQVEGGRSVTKSTNSSFNKGNVTQAGSSFEETHTSSSIYGPGWENRSASANWGDVGMSGESFIGGALFTQSGSFSRTESLEGGMSNTDGDSYQWGSVGYSWSSSSFFSRSLNGNTIIQYSSSTYNGRSSTYNTYGSTTASSVLHTTSRSSSFTFSTSFTQATSLVTTGFEVTTTGTTIRTTTARSSNQAIRISTISGSGTGIYTTTRATNVSYTRETSTNVTTITTRYQALTTTYLPLTAHLIPVMSATRNEFFRLHTVTRSDHVDLGNLLGESVTLFTRSNILYTGETGAAYSSTVSTHTVSSYAFSYGTVGVVTSVGIEAVVTMREFEGFVPMAESATYENFYYGVGSTTSNVQTGTPTIVTVTRTGARSFTAYQLLVFTSLIDMPMEGINSTGGKINFAAKSAVEIPVWTTYINWEGKPGDSITTYRNPQSPLIMSSAGGLQVSRVERANGYQAPDELGSDAPMGGYLVANNSFYVGWNNLFTGSPDDLMAPMPYYTTAWGGDNFSLSIGSNGVWSITKNSTNNTFTASISLGGVGDKFRVAELAAGGGGRAIGGGAHGRPGANQTAYMGGNGVIYTLNGVSHKSVVETPITLTLGSNIIAAETFRAGLANPNLVGGTPANYMQFNYSAP